MIFLFNSGVLNALLRELTNPAIQPKHNIDYKMNKVFSRGDGVSGGICIGAVTGDNAAGGSLGVGIPGALAAKLANPEKTVIGFTGDGGSMYTIQALWTAAHHNIGAKFVICNNQRYMLLELNIMQYWKDQGIPEHEFPASFKLDNPMVDFVGLANAMGVPGARVSDQSRSALRYVKCWILMGRF